MANGRPVTFGGGFAGGFTAGFGVVDQAIRTHQMGQELEARREGARQQTMDAAFQRSLETLQMFEPLIEAAQTQPKLFAEGTANREMLNQAVDALRKTAQATGRDPSVADRVAQTLLGRLEVRPQFEGTTDLGKVFQDIQSAKAAFGENSPQVQALQELSEQEGPIDLEDERGIRQEFTRLSGEFITVRDFFSRIEQVSKTEPTAAGDLSLIFSFMKILDPASVVREGEQATAASAAGVPDRIRNLYNRLLTGERLGEAQREDFIERSRQFFSAQLQQQQALEEQFTSLARRSGVRPENIVIDFAGDLRKAAEPKQEKPKQEKPKQEQPVTRESLEQMSDDELDNLALSDRQFTQAEIDLIDAEQKRRIAARGTTGRAGGGVTLPIPPE